MLPVMLTGVSGRPAAARVGGGVTEGPRRAPLARRRWRAVAVTAGIVALFCCAQRQASQMGVQSDGAATTLQAWAMLHGNLLLHGWYLSDVSFYTTELPEYVLVEMVCGLNPDVVRFCAALTYTLLVVLAAAVAYGARAPGRLTPDKRTAAVRAGIAVAVMLGPTVAATTVLLNDPDHTGTAVPILVVALILDRARRRWWVPAVVAAVLGWALVGDSLVLLIGVAPLVIVCGARAFLLLAFGRVPLRAARYDLSLAAAGVAAWAGGSALSRLLRASDGFTVSPDKARYVAQAAAISSNASATLANFLKLFSADFFGARLDDWLLVTTVHLAFVGLVAAGLVLALRGLCRDFRCRPRPRPRPRPDSRPGPVRIPRPDPLRTPRSRPDPDFRPDPGGGDLVAELIAVAIVINLLAYLLLYLGSLATVREIAPVFGLGAALAGRLLGEPLLRRRLEPLLAVGAVAAIAMLVPPLVSVKPTPPDSVGLARFLAAHHLRSGLAGYWDASSTTLDTGQRVIVAPVQFRPGHGLSAYLWEIDARLFNSQANEASFVVASPPRPGQVSAVTPAQAIAQFGRPYQRYSYQGFAILVWRKNLLTDLEPPSL
jgi:hypothetical protein